MNVPTYANQCMCVCLMNVYLSKYMCFPKCMQSKKGSGVK